MPTTIKRKGEENARSVVYCFVICFSSLPWKITSLEDKLEYLKENNSLYYLNLKSREKLFRYKDLMVKTGYFLHWDYDESSLPEWKLHCPKHIYHESIWMKCHHFLSLYMLRILPHSVSFPSIAQGLEPKIKTQGQFEGTQSALQGGTLTGWPTHCGVPGTFPVLSSEGPVFQESP